MTRPRELPRGASVLLSRSGLAAGMPPVPPPGYRVRTWCDADEVAMPRLLGAAFGPWRSTLAQLKQFWALHPGIVPEGIFAIDDAGGELAATATGRIDPGAPTRGYVHLVATDAAQRRCGLATLAVTHVLHYLAGRGARTAVVGTGAHRVAAIALYRKLGFGTGLDTHDGSARDVSRRREDVGDRARCESED